MLCFFFFNDTATTEIYTLPLHDALPICGVRGAARAAGLEKAGGFGAPSGRRGWPCAGETADRLSRHASGDDPRRGDRKSTRLNSSHGYISYAGFCLKKKTKSFSLTADWS